jgi:hypothetical protein
MKRASRPVIVFVAVALGSLALAACSSGGGDPKDALKSAGGLSESRLPNGIKGDTPAPTGYLARDKALEAGWYKHAKEGQKAPSYNDRASAPIGG